MLDPAGFSGMHQDPAESKGFSRVQQNPLGFNMIHWASAGFTGSARILQDALGSD